MRLANKFARLLLAALLLVLLPGLSARADDGPCSPLVFDGAHYTICRFDLRHDKLALYNLDKKGVPYGTFSALKAAVKSDGHDLIFAMNAGMFDTSLKPIGLYVENGRELKKINRRNGGGNFHLKPNGVFWFGKDEAGVTETEAFLKRKAPVEFATQSGPMLVINGDIHPKFSPASTSFKIRNGVGSIDPHQVVFAISDTPVSFYAFARMFRDGVKAENALFLDGSISSLYVPSAGRDDSFRPLGPMIGVVK